MEFLSLIFLGVVQEARFKKMSTFDYKFSITVLLHYNHISNINAVWYLLF